APHRFYGRANLQRVGAEFACGVAAGEGARHLVAHHLPYHGSGAARDVRRVRDDDDADELAHARPSMTSHTASTINWLERAPGSMCPFDRSPRNDARPRTASSGLVAATASAARWRRADVSSLPPAAGRSATGPSTSSIVFIPISDFPRAFTASTAARKAPAICARSGMSVRPLPRLMKSVP